jgi:Trypsin-like peptidase domain/Effector-associated domain 1
MEERLVEKGSAQALALGRAEEALKLLQGRTDRSPVSPLFALEARANVMLGRSQSGLAVLDIGIAAAAEAGEHRQMLMLALESADIVLAYDLRDKSTEQAERLRELTVGDWPDADSLELLSRLLALMKMNSESGIAAISNRVATLFDGMTDRELLARPAAARWAAATIEPPTAKSLARVFFLTGVPQEPKGDVRSLAAAIAAFDGETSRGSPTTLVTIAQELRLPQRGSLTATWTEFLLDGSNQARRVAIRRLMNKWPVPASVIAAAATLLRGALGLFRAEAASTAGSTESRGSGDISPNQVAALVDVLCRVFERNELYEFVSNRLGRKLEAISSTHVSYAQTVFELVTTASRENWLDQLVQNALEARRGNAELAKIASDLGFSTLTSNSLATVIRSSPTFVEPAWFAKRLGDIQSWVCLVETPASVRATGFLVGLDLVLTADFVVDNALDGKASAESILLRFDYLSTDQDSRGGTVFRLAKDAVVAHGPDYALLRISQPVGAFPVGGAGTESIALPRRWFEINSASTSHLEGETLFTVAHVSGGPMQLSAGTLRSIDRNGRMLYDVFTAPGSAGAPVLAADLRLVGMHLGKDSRDGREVKINYGILISSILEDLGRKGFGSLVGQALA